MKKETLRYPRQKAETITENPIFQREVQKIRHKWDIPKQGFKTNEKREQWYRQLIQRSDDYSNSKEYREKALSIRQKSQTLTHERYPYKKYEEDIDELNCKIPINNYHNDLLSLRRKAGLSDYWENFIEGYLETNKIGLLWLNNSVIETQLDSKTGERKLFIRIWEHTRQKDIKKIWKMVKIHQERLPGFTKASRKSNPKIIERDIFIYNLHLKGKTVSEIAHSLSFDFAKKCTVEEEELYAMTDDAIRKVISRMKKVM